MSNFTDQTDYTDHTLSSVCSSSLVAQVVRTKNLIWELCKNKYVPICMAVKLKIQMNCIHIKLLRVGLLAILKLYNIHNHKP